MLENEERPRPRHAAVEPRRGRQPRWLLPSAVGICAAGAVIGLVLSIGAIRTSGGEAEPQAGVGRLHPADASTPGASESQTPPPTTAAAAPSASLAPPPTTVESPAARAEPSTLISAPPDDANRPADVWVLRSAWASLCLEPVPDQPAVGAYVQQADCTGADNQQWLATAIDEDTVTLTNVSSGLCLEIEGRYSLFITARARQAKCADEPNQRWRVRSAPNEQVYLVARHSGMCLEVPRSARKPGGQVRQDFCDQGNNQRWAVG